MNTRDYKLFRPNNYYHVYNRGNNKEPIFLDDQDYFNFLKRLKIILGLARIPLASEQGESLLVKYPLRLKPVQLDSFSILCYCLMPNHFHFLIKQNADLPISKLITKLCTSYVSYFNKKHKHVGNLFQDTFKAKLVDNDSYLTYLSAYIHNNPRNPLEYGYSSFKDYLGLRAGEICDKKFIMGYFNHDVEKYKKFVLGFSEKERQEIKHLIFEE